MSSGKGREGGLEWLSLRFINHLLHTLKSPYTPVYTAQLYISTWTYWYSYDILSVWGRTHRIWFESCKVSLNTLTGRLTPGDKVGLNGKFPPPEVSLILVQFRVCLVDQLVAAGTPPLLCSAINHRLAVTKLAVPTSSYLYRNKLWSVRSVYQPGCLVVGTFYQFSNLFVFLVIDYHELPLVV